MFMSAEVYILKNIKKRLPIKMERRFFICYVLRLSLFQSIW